MARRTLEHRFKILHQRADRTLVKQNRMRTDHRRIRIQRPPVRTPVLPGSGHLCGIDTVPQIGHRPIRPVKPRENLRAVRQEGRTERRIILQQQNSPVAGVTGSPQDAKLAQKTPARPDRGERARIIGPYGPEKLHGLALCGEPGALQFGLHIPAAIRSGGQIDDVYRVNRSCQTLCCGSCGHAPPVCPLVAAFGPGVSGQTHLNTYRALGNTPSVILAGELVKAAA